MKTPTTAPLLLRRRDSAQVLGCSEAQTLVYERKGLLTPLRLETAGRMVRLDASEVYALAKRLIADAKAAASR